jgi:predicted DNA-binding transcriptional regulator YafY
MSALTPILRHITLLNFLQEKRDGATLFQIGDHMAAHLDIDGTKYLQRTFQRDKDAIGRDYKVDIAYDHARKVYRIINSPAELGSKTLEAFELLNAVLQKGELSNHLVFDTRRAKGLEHFQVLLRAIETGVRIKLTYQSFYDTEPTRRLVEPLALKEFKGRWYLIATDKDDLEIKTFGLDRIGGLELTKKKFSDPFGFDPAELFSNCFGISRPLEGDNVEEVILSFSTEQGRYIKNYPLHKSQRELEGSEDEYRISLNIFITFDFIMELLSYGEDVEVVAPERLKQIVIKRYEAALNLYQA